MATWTASLQFDGYVFTNDPGGTQTPGVEWRVGLEAICLPVLDPMPQFNATPDEGDFALFVGYQDSLGFTAGGVPGAFQYVLMRLGDAEVKPTSWAKPFITPGFSGASTALLTAGGTLTIEKDTTAGTITFTGPLGTETVTLAAIDALPGGPFGYDNSTPLRPRGIAHWAGIPAPTFADPAFDEDNVIQWYNLLGQQNAVTYDTVALSTVDPGNWWPIAAFAFDPLDGQTTSLTPWWTYTQLAAREKVEFIVLTASFPNWRLFATFRRRRALMAANPLDLCAMAEHDMVWGVWASGALELTARRSHDHGHTWHDLLVESTTTGDSPTIQTFAGQVWVCYHDGTNIVTRNSVDLGTTWSTSMPVAITGTNPRLVIAPDGTFFYFYFSGADLVLSRSADLGTTLLDGVPIPITSGVGAQEFGAVLAADRSLVVAYINTGSWESKRSVDWGLSWLIA